MVDPAALREALEHSERLGESGLDAPFKVILAAAWEFLRLMETAESVWWCENHVTQSRGMLSGEMNHRQCWESYHNDWDPDGCRMVVVVLTVRRET